MREYRLDVRFTFTFLLTANIVIIVFQVNMYLVYWTAARDAHSKEQFVWGSNNKSIIAPLEWQLDESVSKYFTCVRIHIASTTGLSSMWIADCSLPAYILCEM